jgi:glutamine synthetase
MADAKSIAKKLKDEEIRFVDLRFTDPRGKMQHLTMDSGLMDEEAFAEGVMFDGSSIAGWKAINESDMKLMPDCNSAVLDPFFAQNTLAVFCNILEPLTDEPYEIGRAHV